MKSKQKIMGTRLSGCLTFCQLDPVNCPQSIAVSLLRLGKVHAESSKSIMLIVPILRLSWW